MATGQHVRYVVDVSDNLYPALVRDERAAASLEKSLGGINSQIRNIAGAVGVGFGLHALFAGSKEWIKDVAELETGLLRVKNASSDLATGIKNQLFIQDEVKNFKVGLQETVDAYGSFLFKIKNANLSNDVQNRLYENLMMVSKTAALPQSEMDATVRNVGIMLGEGVLEARHLRGLSYVHPQIVPFLAEAIGLKSGEADAFTKILKDRDESDSASQKLSQLISSGKLTKAALPANVIIEAFEAYRKSIEGGLPETLLTIESATNELSNSWLDLKNTIVMELKPEIIGLFKDLEGGIHWLKENKDNVIALGQNIIALTKVWVAYKATMLLVNGAMSSYRIFSAWYAGAAVSEIALTNTKAASFNALALAIERMNIANQHAMVYGAAGLGTSGIPLMAAGGGAALSGGAVAGTAAGGALAGVTVTSGALLVALAAGSVFAITDIMSKLIRGKHMWEGDDQQHYLKNMGNGTFSGMGANFKVGATGLLELITDDENKKTGQAYLLENYLKYKDSKDPFLADIYKQGLLLASKNKSGTKGAGGKAVPADDRAIGQRVITYNITINGGLNGQKIDTQNVNNGSDIDMKVITEKVAQSLEAVMNDTQLHSD